MLLSGDDDTTGYGRRKATMTDSRVYASPNMFLPITAYYVRVVTVLLIYLLVTVGREEFTVRDDTSGKSVSLRINAYERTAIYN